MINLMSDPCTGVRLMCILEKVRRGILATTPNGATVRVATATVACMWLVGVSCASAFWMSCVSAPVTRTVISSVARLVVSRVEDDGRDEQGMGQRRESLGGHAIDQVKRAPPSTRRSDFRKDECNVSLFAHDLCNVCLPLSLGEVIDVSVHFRVCASDCACAVRPSVLKACVIWLFNYFNNP